MIINEEILTQKEFLSALSEKSDCGLEIKLQPSSSCSHGAVALGIMATGGIGICHRGTQ